MNQLTKLKQMGEITQMVLDAELAKMSAAQAEVDRLRAQLEVLSEEQRAMQDMAEGDDMAALLLGDQARKWMLWAERERSQINTKLAAALAALETQRAETRLAFGRVEALKAVQKKERERLAKDRAARAFLQT